MVFDRQNRHGLLPQWLVVLAAAGAGLLVARSIPLALGLALLPALVLLLLRPRAVAVGALIVLPLTYSVFGSDAGVNVSLFDSLLLLAALGLLPQAVSARTRACASQVRPLLPFLACYGVALALALASHASWDGLVNTLQRAQLVVLPLALGVALAEEVWRRRALAAYCLGTTAFAVAYLLQHDSSGAFGLQKNPSAQFMAGAILIVTARQLPARWTPVLLPPLGVGLVATGSRGAMVATLAGLAVQVAWQTQRRHRTVTGLMALTLVLCASVAALPASERARLLQVSGGEAALSGSLSAAQYTVVLRRIYREDAHEVIAQHPFSGVGIASYQTGSGLTLTNDPHNVLLLEAAEGGIPLAATYLLLMTGSAVVVVRRRRDASVAVLAAALQVSLLVHGLLDVYWVRGTPALGWLVVGMVLGSAGREESSPPTTSQQKTNQATPPSGAGERALTAHA